MVNLDYGYTEVEAYKRGRKEKVWFMRDHQRYLYKYGAINYEIYAELIAEQLGRQCGIDMAMYRIAKYKNTIGVVTKSFIKPGELIISSDKLKKAVQSIYEENNLEGNLKGNTIKNLVEAAFTYDGSLKTEKLYRELVKRWMFAGLIVESDKNDTNISFLRKKGKLFLSPDYDNSTMARLNENINEIIATIRTPDDIYRATDCVKQDLKPEYESSDLFLESLREFSIKRPDLVEEIMESFENVNVEKAIKKVEQLNKIEVPWEVKYFTEKVIETRKNDMKSILHKAKQKQV